MMRIEGVAIAGALGLTFAGLALSTPETSQSSLVSVALPDGAAGIGFDDLTFAPASKRVLVPGGRTGRLFLVDPVMDKITSIAGFSAEASYQGGHGEGTTSADEGAGFFFATDRNTQRVVAIDAASKRIVASTTLAASPDYVRFVGPRREVWVTEPSAESIEVFSLGTGKAALTHSANIPVPGGPESLVVDASRGRAYTHLWTGTSVAFDLKSRKIAARWPNGCRGSRGIALDEKRGFLFVGCYEGKAVVLDAAHDGKILGTLESGAGVDVIAYNPTLAHLYLPGADSATMAVIAVSPTGALSLSATLPISKGAHCVAADELGNAWVCDPKKGRLLKFADRESKP